MLLIVTCLAKGKGKKKENNLDCLVIKRKMGIASMISHNPKMIARLHSDCLQGSLRLYYCCCRPRGLYDVPYEVQCIAVYGRIG